MLIISNCLFEEVLKILTLADIHYDPLYKNDAGAENDRCRQSSGALAAPAGRIGCDSPINLIDKAVANSAEHGPYDLIFTMGDLPAHGLIQSYPTYNDRNLSNNATKYVANSIHNQYPNNMILGVLGNNEGDGNYNYSTINNSARLRELYYDCGYNHLTNNNPKFLEFGYYSQDTKHNITIIALNQNFYTKKAQPQVGNQSDPGAQFKFLEAELQRLNKTRQQAIILYHGSFGVNGFDSRTNTMDTFTEQYAAIVKKFKNVVICEFIGHYHQDQFRYRMDGRRAYGPGFLVPSISPNNGNNPGFRIVQLRRENGIWKLDDYEQYFLDLNIANYNVSQGLEFNFKFQYKFSEFYALFVENSKKAQPNVRNIQYLNDQMRVDDELYSRWIATSNLWYSPQMAENYCAIDSISQAEYKECVRKFKFDK